jgi:hypothetical protein
MKKLNLGGILLAALLAGPAMAADLPVQAPVYQGAGGCSSLQLDGLL